MRAKLPRRRPRCVSPPFPWNLRRSAVWFRMRTGRLSRSWHPRGAGGEAVIIWKHRGLLRSRKESIVASDISDLELEAMQSDLESDRVERKPSSGYLPFDLRTCSGATIDDLDIGYIEAQYLPRAVAQDVLDENRRPLMQQLRSLRLLADKIPTWGALLGFGCDPLGWIPGAYVQFVRIDGDTITDPFLSQHRLTGRLEDVLRRLDELLKLNIRTGVDVRSGAREIRLPDYPVTALQQLAFNAVMHRNYEGTNAPVRIYWYSSRIEISSPGGLYGQVTRDNFGTGPTDYRNPLLAEIMHNLGYAKQSGLGISLAREQLKEKGNPSSDFDLGPAHVAVTVRAVP